MHKNNYMFCSFTMNLRFFLSLLYKQLCIVSLHVKLPETMEHA